MCVHFGHIAKKTFFKSSILCIHLCGTHNPFVKFVFTPLLDNGKMKRYRDVSFSLDTHMVPTSKTGYVSDTGTIFLAIDAHVTPINIIGNVDLPAVDQ